MRYGIGPIANATLNTEQNKTQTTIIREENTASMSHDSSHIAYAVSG